MASLLSQRDTLTGLPSRHAGLAILQGSIGHNGRVALLLCDVDWILPFNDKFGHLRGDKELRRIARDLERTCAPSSVFRFGGDEFGVILHEVSLEQARELANQILASQLPQLVPSAGRAPYETLSLSIGFALFPTQATNAENLLDAADGALLRAKRGGRLSDGTPYAGRNRAMTWGDFLDESPEQSA